MASLLSAGTLPFEYLPLSTPDASGLQMVVPEPECTLNSAMRLHAATAHHKGAMHTDVTADCATDCETLVSCG